MVGSALLVDLCERRLDEGGRASNRRDDPHPENSASATRRHCRRDASDVTDAHARGRGDHQRTEGGDAAFLFRRLHDDTECLSEHAEGERAGEDEEVQAHADQQCDQYVGVHEVGNGAENGCNHGSS